MELGAVQELWRYNDWANERLLGAVLGLTSDQFRRNLGGSYPSVQATITHIIWAEWIWLERWSGRAARRVFAPEEFPAAADVAPRWAEVRSELRRYLGTLSTEQLRQPFRYVNRQGQTWEYPLWRQLYHVLNHSSYHRGQVTNMLRQLGVQPPTTDFLDFWDAIA